MPKVAELLEEAEEDLIAFSAFPEPHWSKVRSTNPLERVNCEIGRRSDVVGIFPKSLALVLVDEDEREPQREEVRALQPA